MNALFSQLVIPDWIRDPCLKTTTVRAEPVEAVFAFYVCGLPEPVGRGLPGGNSLSFASPKESKQRKGDPAVCDPSSLTLRGVTCGARSSRGRARLASLKIARPDPSGPALLGAYRRVEERNEHGNKNPESLKRAALQGRDSQAAVMFARERSARGQIKSPSIAQRGEGGARGGSGESKLLPWADNSSGVMPTTALPAAKGADT